MPRRTNAIDGSTLPLFSGELNPQTPPNRFVQESRPRRGARGKGREVPVAISTNERPAATTESPVIIERTLKEIEEDEADRREEERHLHEVPRPHRLH